VIIANDAELIKNELKDIKPECKYFSLQQTKILTNSVGKSEFEYKNNIYGLNIEGEQISKPHFQL
jgi:hypothetical protein